MRWIGSASIARSCRSPTPWGEVRVKVARRGGEVLNAQPEFDDVARLAAEHGVPIKDVHAQAQKAWLDKRS